MATAKKKTARRKPARSSTSNLQSTMSEYVPMPPPKLGSNRLLLLLVIVLVLFSGYLFFRIQTLEKATGIGTDVAQEVGQQPTPGAKVDVNVGHLPALGNKNAPVTVIEFSDFQCPFCKNWHETVAPDLKSDYINTGKVKFYFRHYAFLGDESTWAAEASECANEQGKFWEYHDYLFSHQGGENQGDFSKANLEGFAAQLGLNTTQFNSCLETDKYTQKVKDDLAAGQKVGVQGTPSTFINGYMIDGAQPFSVFKAKIDEQLKK